MDLLYVVGDHSAWEHNELRYSMRSVCANMPHDRVIVSGHKPTWLQGVEHVPGKDDKGSAARNAQTKALAALKSGLVGDRFKLMSDDLFILQPWVDDRIRASGKFSDRILRIRRTHGIYDPWRLSMNATLKACRELGVDPVDCEMHHPVPMERDKAIATLQRSLSRTVQVGIGTLYVAMHGAETVPAKNAKSMKWKGAPTSAVFSSSPHVERHLDFREWIHGLFPEPCRYEADTM